MTIIDELTTEEGSVRRRRTPMQRRCPRRRRFLRTSRESGTIGDDGGAGDATNATDGAREDGTSDAAAAPSSERGKRKGT